jgi:hypothetical protein
VSRPLAWIDELVAAGVPFRAVAASPEARAETCPPTDALGCGGQREPQRVDAAWRAASIPVAVGPGRTDVYGRGDHCVVHVHPNDPDRLYVALTRRYPAMLWIPVASAEAFRRLLAAYFPPDAAPGEEKVARLSLGIVRDFFALEERLLDHNPFCDAFGSDESLIPDPGKAQQRVTVRTLHSHTRIEVLAYGGLVTAAFRYRPSPESATIEACNRALGTGFPTDLPVDAAATVIEHPAIGGAELKTTLDGPPGVQILALLALELIQADLSPEDLAGVATSEDSEVRRALRAVAERRGFSGLVASLPR